MKKIYEDEVSVFTKLAERKAEELAWKLDRVDPSLWQEFLPEKQPMETEEQQVARAKQDIVKSLDFSKLYKGLGEGFSLIEDEGPHYLTVEEQEIVRKGMEHAQEVFTLAEDEIDKSFIEVFDFSRPFILAIQKIGDSLFQKERVEDAKNVYFWLTLIDPKEPNHCLGLGHCLMTLGEYDKASVAYSMGLEIDPGSLLFIVYIGIAGARAGNQKLAHLCQEEAKRIASTSDHEIKEEEKGLIELLDKFIS